MTGSRQRGLSGFLVGDEIFCATDASDVKRIKKVLLVGFNGCGGTAELLDDASEQIVAAVAVGGRVTGGEVERNGGDEGVSGGSADRERNSLACGGECSLKGVKILEFLCVEVAAVVEEGRDVDVSGGWDRRVDGRRGFELEDVLHLVSKG